MRALLVLTLLASPAVAGLHDPEWNPPARFEQTFPDHIVIHKVDPADVISSCQRLIDSRRIAMKAYGTHGCSVGGNSDCEVVIPSRPVEGAAPASILRHEIGHCSGWPVDHPN